MSILIYFVALLEFALCSFEDSYFLQSRKRSLLRALETEEIKNVKCFYVNQTSYSFYSLSNFYNSTNDYTYQKNGYEYFYNFCNNTMEKCGENETSFYYKKDGSCKKLAGNIDGEEKSKNYITVNDKLLTLHLSEGDLCSNGQNYQINFEFECNSEAEYIKQGTLSVDLSSIDPSKCIQTFTVKGVREACEIANFYALSHFFEEHKFLVGIIIIIIGLFLTFLGKKLEEVTVVLVSDLVVPGVLLIILYNIFSVTQTWIPWVVIIIGILLGIGLGIFLLKLENIFGAVLGGTLGYIVGLLLYNAFLSKIQSNPSVVYWITIVVCIIVCAILGYALYSYCIIIGTVVGAYVTIRGISLLAGGFPSESLVIDLIQKKEWDELKQFIL